MIEKDFRALLPVWVASAVALLAAAHPINAFPYLGLPAYFIGAACLGALMVGHEYSHRTLPMLLSLPVRRSRIWLSKLAVTAALLLGLCAIAAFTLPAAGLDLRTTSAIYILPVLGGLFVAPWLTMAGRSPLAGVVFTIGIAGLLLLAGAWIGFDRYGYTDRVDAFRVTFAWWSMSGVCAVGAVMGWRTFASLQAIDGRGPDVDLSFGRRRAAAPGVTKGHPVWLLVKKELRLQQLAWVVAGIYVAVYVVLTLTKRGTADVDAVVTIMSVFYCGLLALLIGSLASAEERQLGTHDTQLLLPMSALRQWIVKAGTALGLAALLTIVLPTLLLMLLPFESGRVFRHQPFLERNTIFLVMALTSVSLYVSSLTGSGLRALMLSLPAVFAAVLFIGSVAFPLGTNLSFALRHAEGRRFGRGPFRFENDLWIVLLAALLGLVLYFALTNHRSADRGIVRIGTQMLWLGACTTALFALSGWLAALR